MEHHTGEGSNGRSNQGGSSMPQVILEMHTPDYPRDGIQILRIDVWAMWRYGYISLELLGFGATLSVRWYSGRDEEA